MVVPSFFKDILQCFNPNTVFNLPPLKGKTLKLEYEKSDALDVIYSQATPILPFAVSEVYEADISEWRRLSADDPNCNPIYEITFDIRNNDVDYKPGDTIGIIPRNHKDEVKSILNHLDIEDVADFNYTLTLDCDRKAIKIPPHIPVKATLRHTLTHCVDLRGVVRKVFLAALSTYTEDESEKKILEYLSSKEGFLAYTANILNKSVCLLDMFRIFKSCKPPVEVILEHLPRLLPRPYSICSSQLKHSKKIKICFSVKDIGVCKECSISRKGLTTGWMELLIHKSDDVNRKLEELSLNDTSKIPFYFRKNANEFRMPEDLTAPIILIGPGTGVAPFIGFLEEREYLINNHSEHLGRTWLFNGCRYSKLDFIYEKELQSFIDKGVLNKMSTAFSRDENVDNRYVQDCIAKHGKEVAKLIEDGAYIFVCGDVNKMAKDVKAAIIKCIEEHTDKQHEEAVQFISDLEKEKRYLVDVWN